MTSDYRRDAKELCNAGHYEHKLTLKTAKNFLLAGGRGNEDLHAGLRTRSKVLVIALVTVGRKDRSTTTSPIWTSVGLPKMSIAFNTTPRSDNRCSMPVTPRRSHRASMLKLSSRLGSPAVPIVTEISREPAITAASPVISVAIARRPRKTSGRIRFAETSKYNAVGNSVAWTNRIHPVCHSPYPSCDGATTWYAAPRPWQSTP
jgi:hypothetical protein